MAMDIQTAGGMPPSKLKLVLCALGVVISLIILMAGHPGSPKNNLINPKTQPLAVFGDWNTKSPSAIPYAVPTADAKKTDLPAADLALVRPATGPPMAGTIAQIDVTASLPSPGKSPERPELSCTAKHGGPVKDHRSAVCGQRPGSDCQGCKAPGKYDRQGELKPAQS